MSSRSERSLSYARKRCFENCLSIYGLLRVQRHSLYFFFFSFPFARLFFFFLFSQALSHTLPLFLTLFFSIHSHIARTATGVVSFFFFLFLSSKYRVASCPRFLRVSVLRDKTILVSSCRLSTFARLRKPKKKRKKKKR